MQAALNSTEEKREKEYFEEYQRITNEIDVMKKDLIISDQNIKEGQENHDSREMTQSKLQWSSVALQTTNRPATNATKIKFSKLPF